MEITARQVQHIASLARLHLDEAEAREMGEQLGSILEHMSSLQRVDVAGVPPLRGVTDQPAPLREDVVRPDPPLERAPAALAPEWAEGLFLVPRLAALDTDGGDSAGDEG